VALAAKVTIGTSNALQTVIRRLPLPRPVVRVDAVVLRIRLWIRILAGLSPQTILLEGDLSPPPGIGEYFGETAKIALQRLRLTGLPVVLQFDADQLDQDRRSQRMGLVRQKGIQIGPALAREDSLKVSPKSSSVGRIGIGGRLQQGAELQANLLQVAFDSALGPSDDPSNFGHLVTLNAQFEHLALSGRQIFHRLRDGHLQAVKSASCRWSVTSTGTIGALPASAANVALAGALIRFLGPDTVKRNNEEQSPQFLAGWHVVLTLFHTPEESAEHRLNHVFRLDAPLHLGEHRARIRARSRWA